MAPTPPAAVDARMHVARDVFDRLVHWVLVAEPDPTRVRQRLWKLPLTCISFAFEGSGHPDRDALSDLRNQLRQRIAEIVESVVDRDASRAALAARLRAASERCVLRPWTAADAPVFADLLDDAGVWAQLPDERPGPIDTTMAAQMIAIANEAPARHLVRAVCWGGMPIGQVRLLNDHDQDAAEISYWLAPRFWGRGLATDAVVLMTAAAFTAPAAPQHLYGKVLHGHTASVRVLEKAGYWLEDECCAQIVKNGRPQGQQLLSVRRYDYADLAAPRLPMDRGASVLRTVLLAVPLDQVAANASALAAWI